MIFRMQINPNRTTASSLGVRPTVSSLSLALTCLLIGLLGMAPARAQAPNVTYSGPLVITTGGTYTGNYRSNDESVPAISIQTTQPVIIDNCIIAAVGDLVNASNGGATLTVRNSRAYALPQTSSNVRHGRFVEAVSARSLTIEHNYFEHTTGIDIYLWGGNGTAQQTLTIRYNKCLDIDGLMLNGQESWSNYIGMNGVLGLVGAEIAWNEVINEPNKSWVEDNINFFNSGGVASSHVLVHDNYIQGAYPYPATSPDYAGSGLITDGDAASGSTAASASAFVDAYHNQFVSTCAAINIAAGHDNHFYENRIVTSGLLPDGSRLQANYAAAGLWNAYGKSGSVFFNNDMVNNTIGFYFQGGNTPYTNRQDTSPGACPTCPTIHMPDRVLTLADEQNEWNFWLDKVRQNGITLGPVGAGTSTPPTTTPPAATPPTVSLSAPATGTVGTALALSASAATASGTIAKVEFFSGATKLGEDLTAPYALSFTPTAAGSLSLTARATNSAGAATTSTAANVTVAAAPTTTPTTPPTTTSGSTPPNSTFFRALNVNGSAATIDGHNWEDGTSAANFQVNGGPFAAQTVTLNPATDAARASMIRSSVYDGAISAAVSGITSGTYSVYLYVWEDNNAETFSISLEGQTVQANYNSGAAGHWDRLGPFTANITDGTINVGTSGGAANLSGIEIWKQNSTTTPVATPPTVSLSAPATGTVGKALALSASAATASGTISKVEFFSGATKLGEDLTAPYALSFTPTAAGSLSLTARATNSAGAATTSTAATVSVAAAPTSTVPTFVRAINLGGAAITIDNRSWAAGSSAPNFQASGVTTFANQNITLTPTTGSARASMIRSSMYGNNPSLAISGIASGTYSVYLYVWEDNNAETFNISLEGQTVQANYNSGAAGHWDRLGPFTANITDGTINVGTSGGAANLSGIEIWKK